MSTVILSSASSRHPPLVALAEALAAELAQLGETAVRTFDLAETKLAYCQGEFDCWLKSPGTCRAHDAEQEIAQAVHDAERLVLLDAVSFGGPSYTLKRALDRLICLISPFFEKRAALTHHAARYARQASWFALGWQPVPDAEEAETWRELADANAINFLAPRVGAAVVNDTARDAWPAAIRAMLASTAHPGESIRSRRPLRDALLAAARPDVPTRAPIAPRRAALLIGSAKRAGTSTSEAVARALAARLERHGVAVDLHVATELLHDGPHAKAALGALVDADLVVLATPLYIDALPALATRALERIAETRTALLGPASFAVCINCGFPEPEHVRTALRVARHFAARAGYHWAGGLPLGGGGAIGGKPLDEQHGPAEHVARALDLAAPALARGEDIPPPALALMAETPLPDIAYRVLGEMGWRYEAHRHGLSQRALRARPLD